MDKDQIQIEVKKFLPISDFKLKIKKFNNKKLVFI